MCRFEVGTQSVDLIGACPTPHRSLVRSHGRRAILQEEVEMTGVVGGACRGQRWPPCLRRAAAGSETGRVIPRRRSTHGYEEWNESGPGAGRRGGRCLRDSSSSIGVRRRSSPLPDRSGLCRRRSQSSSNTLSEGEERSHRRARAAVADATPNQARSSRIRMLKVLKDSCQGSHPGHQPSGCGPGRRWSRHTCPCHAARASVPSSGRSHARRQDTLFARLPQRQ